MPITRRAATQGIGALSIALSAGGSAMSATTPPDIILHNGRITTLDRSNPAPQAVAITAGLFSAVGDSAEILPSAGPGTRVIDLGGKRLIPGLIDNHLHIIRGGLNFNMELRWDGVRSLADAMAMLKRQAAITPPPQWVRVVGGFTEHQFVEKRLPTLDEINAAAPDTPVFLLHLYDRALLNGAALRAVGYTKDTPNPPGGEIQRDAQGNPTGLLLARPNATILYATLGKGPKLPPEYQLNSTRHFMRRPQPAGRYRRHRCRRRLAELSGRLCGREKARGGRRTDDPHRLQPVHPEAERRERRFPALDQVQQVPAGRRLFPPEWCR
jgi:predicted amidohydrolase YtcJ